jgi:metal-responsive CopG/Arc/MetJ family transcriptional regulator
MMARSAKKTGPKAPRGQEKKITVGIVLSLETAEMLDKMAQSNSMSRSHVVRRLIKDHFQDHFQTSKEGTV